MPDLFVRLADRSYPIRIEAGSLARLGAFVRECVRPTRLFVVTDRTVGRLYGRAAAKTLAEAGFDTAVLRVAPGERSKSLATVGRLYTQLLKARLDRASALVALGGGVVGDLAGFVAATVLRGVDYLQVPTTVLAQVDSSIGGKTGVNHPLGKNLIGAFCHPRGVLIDPATLATLPEREYVAGLAEVVKTAIIKDAEFLAFLEANTGALFHRETSVLTHAIAQCCRIKAEVVEADPLDRTGLRAILNYGHTVGHALEAVSGYGRYAHGEAVAVGMSVAARMAVRRGLIPAEAAERQDLLLTALGLPIAAAELADPRLVAALYRDKKAEGGRLRFILPTGPGRVAVVDDVTEREVRDALPPGAAR